MVSNNQFVIYTVNPQDLENYMKNRPVERLSRIESMGHELVSLKIMAQSVGAEVQTLADRWANLTVKVISRFFFKFYPL